MTKYIEENTMKTTVPFKTNKGIQYLDIIVPKGIGLLDVDCHDIADAICSMTENNNIPAIVRSLK